MTIKTFSLSLFLAASLGFAGPLIQVQPDACLDYNINHNNCSGALSGTLTVGNDTLTFHDIASVNYGIMHVSTDNTFTVHNDQAWSYGAVSFQDVITINSATHQGQTGFVLLGYHIDGTVSSSGISDAFNQVVMRVNPNTPQLQNWVDDYHGNIPAGTFETHLFQITYGTPFTLYFSMQATGGTAVDSGQGYSFISKTGSGTSSVHFEDTFTLDQLLTEDSAQGAVGDSTFQSQSGTVYTQQGAQIAPEPVMFFPAAIGLAAFAAIRFRKRA